MALSRSLPVWEEWIEMSGGVGGLPPAARLFPYGKSGLKCQAGSEGDEQRASLPVWEEWIEIAKSGGMLTTNLVSSRMGRVD